MERSERYDPEDLEHLMLERSFDELLVEERAYALRHLADRAEYDRMRALLHHVREDKRDHSPMDADPGVREHVLAAFRAQQQPQWRIWLNSVGGFLLPSRPSMYWRPALALGTVAVLIFASLMTWNAMEPKGNKVLAEVRQEPPALPAPAQPFVQAAQPPVAATERSEQKEVANAITSTFSTTKQLEDVDAVASAGGIAKDERTGAAEKAKSEALVTTAVAEPASTGYAQRVEEEHAPVGSADRKRQFKEATVQASSPMAMADVAETRTTQAYTEDDLLGLLRAAW